MTNNPRLKLPYGLSNFKEIRTEGYYYVDKTRYIELLESLPEKYPMILRSRRFGKTLFANMLGYYYDQRRADEFDEIFAGTYIHAHPTPKRGMYLMLTFNFSGINTETLENANQGFTFQVRSSIRRFTEIYREYFSESARERIVERPERPNDLLVGLFDAIQSKGLGKCVYVVIDEYDHFANNILSQGKEMFKELVRTDGYVRPFYEALKAGTEQVVDRMFVTGVLPILLDSLTSGFNIGSNLSTDVRVNEMFGFTDAEISPVMEALGAGVNREDVRVYYNGYRFSPHAAQTVYNSDMIWYYGLKIAAAGRVDNMVDPNAISDYRKIRAILSIGDKALEEQILTRIVEQERLVVPGITALFPLTQETEFLFDEQALLSLLFYMGYLSIAGQRGTLVELVMPNLVLRSLYFDYMQHLLTQRGQTRIDGIRKGEALQALVEGKIDGFIALTEHLLRGLSNRDYERFDEKYIKVVMLSLLSEINIYIPHSEYEVGTDGYVDIYLQAAFEPERSVSYFIELKYVKAKAANALIDRKAEEGAAAMLRYLASDAARAAKHLHGYVLVFRKDRCVRRIACHQAE